jgi:hypothetical protein
MNTSERSAPRLQDLPGLWQRSLIRWPDGRLDTTTTVHWLQGPGFYIDLRQPAARPDFSAVSALEDVDDAQLAWLVRQEGFAGRLVFADGWFEWGREIDLQPLAVYSDCGRLWYEGDHVVEEGRDIKYIEHWHPRHVGDPSRCAAARLRDADGRAGYLVRSGNLFMLARDRAVALPPLGDLAACVAAAPDRAAALACVDCEISFGTVTARGCRIEHSSLPWREGALFVPRLAGSVLELGDPLGGETRSWTLLEGEGEFALLGA